MLSLQHRTVPQEAWVKHAVYHWPLGLVISYDLVSNITPLTLLLELPRWRSAKIELLPTSVLPKNTTRRMASLPGTHELAILSAVIQFSLVDKQLCYSF